MNKEIKNFIKRAKLERLSENEKNTLRAKILEFIAYNPIRGKMPALREKNYISIFEVRSFVKAAAFLLIIAVVAGGSGVSYAAQNSLPGETLYSIKVNVNEAIEEGFARSPEAKVAVQSKKVERRLEEAQTLAKTNKLSADNQKIVIAQIEEHIEELEEGIAALREDGEVELVLETTAKLAPVMEAHKEILEKSGDEGENNGAENLIAKVEDGIKAVENEENETIADVSGEAETDAVVATMMAKAEDLQSEIKKNAKETINEINDDIKDLVKSRIDSAREKIRMIEERQTVLDAKIETDAEINLPVESNTVNIKTEMSAPVGISPSSISLDKATVATTEDQVVIQEFNIESRLKLAEDLLKEATRLYNEEEWRESLSLAQEVNRIASEIETHIHLKELDLAKANSTKTEASAIKSNN